MAYYYAFPDIRTRNSNEHLSAVFTVKPGVNHVQRPIAGGSVGYGVLKGGSSKNHSLSEPDKGKKRPSKEQPLDTPRPTPKRSLFNLLSWIVVAILLVLLLGILWNAARTSNDEPKVQRDQETYLLSPTRYTV